MTIPLEQRAEARAHLALYPLGSRTFEELTEGGDVEHFDALWPLLRRDMAKRLRHADAAGILTKLWQFYQYQGLDGGHPFRGWFWRMPEAPEDREFWTGALREDEGAFSEEDYEQYGDGVPVTSWRGRQRNARNLLHFRMVLQTRYRIDGWNYATGRPSRGLPDLVAPPDIEELFAARRLERERGRDPDKDEKLSLATSDGLYQLAPATRRELAERYYEKMLELLAVDEDADPEEGAHEAAPF